MLNYIVRRLLLLPLTLFCIVLVNFIIINLAPGDPVTVTEVSQEGAASRRDDRSVVFGSDERYLQFREHYGLTLPILFNTWPLTTQEYVDKTLDVLQTRRAVPGDKEEMSLKDYDALRTEFGDRSRFVMPKLLHVIEDPHAAMALRSLASRFFMRGGTRQAIVGPNISEDARAYNRKAAQDSKELRGLVIAPDDSAAEAARKGAALRAWYESNQSAYTFEPDGWQQVRIFFVETRLWRYLGKVATLDFGTMRNDSNKTVISEVTKRFKYSLTIAILPMFLTFALCQLFGGLMAYRQNRWQDYSLSIVFLVLYALPVFVVAPFLIEKVALNGHFPFTDIPIPISGFTSPDSIYNQLNSGQRLFDVLQHICLPVVAVMYGSLAAESRLSRTAILEVLRQDFVRTARAKGLPPAVILFKHVGRNAAVTIVTALAGSLGMLLGGSLIVETLFEIDGFGKFFYDAIVNRDYNVIMFSTLAGAFFSLAGYLAADIAYTVLDPRLTLE